jgi:hypothetical protein
VCCIAWIFWWFSGGKIVISHSEQDSSLKSNITGLACPNANRRPIAVMLASDPVARPLSGVSQADIVFEMPVTPNGVTRYMTVFQCQQPTEIGSVRSARDGFLPLVAMLDAIYAHWGGEAGALAQLNKHILDNIDALKYEETYFFRKKGIKPPHNGFTTYEKLVAGAEKLKYPLELQEPSFSFSHSSAQPAKNLANIVHSISIAYSSPYDVRWEFDEKENTYKRFRNGTPEIDATTHTPVTADVVIVLESTAKPFSDQYVSVATQGNGKATIYQQGISISGTWQKDSTRLDAPLLLIDGKGHTIPLAEGTLWVLFTTP